MLTIKMMRHFLMFQELPQPKINANENIALSAKAKLTRHYHLATRGQSAQQLQEETMKLILKDIQSPR